MKKFLLTLGWTAVCIMVLSSGCKSGDKYVGYPSETQKAASQQPAGGEDKGAVAAVKEAEPKQAAAQPQQPSTPAAEPNVAVQLAVPADPNTVLVTVNSEGITEGRLDNLVKPMLEQRQAMGQQANQDAIDQMKSQMLDNLIIDALVTQQIKIHNVVVTDDDVENHIRKMLATVEPPMTVEDLKSRIQRMGRTYEQWKQMMGFQKRMEMEKLLEINYPSQMDITDANARKFYDDNLKYFQKPEQVRASHILFVVDKKDPNKVAQLKADAKKKAEDTLDQIRKGADFAEMAKKYSEDETTAKRGGDLYYFEKRMMVPEFANAAFDLKVGQISDVVETTYGYHIIKVTDHRDPNTVPFEKAKPSIVDSLKTQKEETLVEAYLEKLRNEAKIVYPPGSNLRASQPSESQIKQPPAPAGAAGRPQQRPAPATGDASQPAPKQPTQPAANQPN